MCRIRSEKLSSKLNFLDIDYDDGDLECNLPLLEGAVLSATTSLNERGPENARLNGELFLSKYRLKILYTFFCCACYFKSRKFYDFLNNRLCEIFFKNSLLMMKGVTSAGLSLIILIFCLMS